MADLLCKLFMKLVLEEQKASLTDRMTDRLFFCL